MGRVRRGSYADLAFNQPCRAPMAEAACVDSVRTSSKVGVPAKTAKGQIGGQRVGWRFGVK